MSEIGTVASDDVSNIGEQGDVVEIIEQVRTSVLDETRESGSVIDSQSDSSEIQSFLDETKLEIVKRIAEESMQQEKDRSELVQSKAQNLIKYISATIGVVNAVFVFLLEHEIVKQCALFWMALFIDIPFVISLFIAVAAQILMKAYFYPTGLKMLQDMESQESSTLLNYEVYNLKCMSIYTEQLCSVNNKRAGLVTGSYVMYLVGLVIMLGMGIITAM